MARDFSGAALPLPPPQKGALTPSTSRFEKASWAQIFDAANNILSACVRAPSASLVQSGWATVPPTKPMDEAGIVVAFWSRNSAIDGLYGPGVVVVGQPMGGDGGGNETETDTESGSGRGTAALVVRPAATGSVQTS